MLIRVPTAPRQDWTRSHLIVYGQLTRGKDDNPIVHEQNVYVMERRFRLRFYFRKDGTRGLLEVEPVSGTKWRRGTEWSIDLETRTPSALDRRDLPLASLLLRESPTGTTDTENALGQPVYWPLCTPQLKYAVAIYIDMPPKHSIAKGQPLVKSTRSLWDAFEQALVEQAAREVRIREEAVRLLKVIVDESKMPPFPNEWLSDGEEESDSDSDIEPTPPKRVCTDDRSPRSTPPTPPRPNQVVFRRRSPGKRSHDALSVYIDALTPYQHNIPDPQPVRSPHAMLSVDDVYD